jgi:hypothetical protein
MPPAQSKGWDADSHEALLISCVEEVMSTQSGKPFLTKVTERMKEKGYSYSYDAI